MEWYVLSYDRNSKKVIPYNIFNSVRFIQNVNYTLIHKDNYKDIKKEIRSDCMNVFWGRIEHEYSIGALFENNCENLIKMDAWDQLEPNLQILTDYILSHEEQVFEIYQYLKDIGYNI